VPEATELADFEKMSEIRSRIDQIVRDPVAADLLKPWYRRYCKRPTFNDEYLPAFNRPNVHLIDASSGVDRITPTGVVIDSRHYELDCLIFASGFELPMTSYANRAGFDAVGLDGITLSTHWANGMRSMFGVHMHGFPNLFHVGYSPQGVATATFTHLLEELADHIVHLVRYALDNGTLEMELTPEAEAEWVQHCIALGTPLHTGEVDPTGRAFLSDCLPGFFSAAFAPAPRPTDEPTAAHSVATYGKGPMAFFRLLHDWRAAGEFAGLELRS
jgi:cyclohexanone monooxygenase